MQTHGTSYSARPSVALALGVQRRSAHPQVEPRTPTSNPTDQPFTSVSVSCSVQACARGSIAIRIGPLPGCHYRHLIFSTVFTPPIHLDREFDSLCADPSHWIQVASCRRKKGWILDAGTVLLPFWQFHASTPCLRLLGLFNRSSGPLHPPRSLHHDARRARYSAALFRSTFETI
jgi:hypothetical protein